MYYHLAYATTEPINHKINHVLPALRHVLLALCNQVLLYATPATIWIKDSYYLINAPAWKDFMIMDKQYAVNVTIDV